MAYFLIIVTVRSNALNGNPTVVNQICLATADNTLSMLIKKEQIGSERFSSKGYGSLYIYNKSYR